MTDKQWMDASAIIGEPRYVQYCHQKGCDRMVGPYHSERAAIAAIDEHDYLAHNAVRMVGQCPAA